MKKIKCLALALTVAVNALLSGTLCMANEACEHTFTVYDSIAATCTEGGFNILECSKCGDMKDEEIPPTGHSYTAQGTKPTCTEAGSTVYTCTNCGDTYTEEAPAFGHRNVATYLRAPTATATGLRTEECTVCGKRTSTTLAALGSHIHSYRTTVTAPTLSIGGYTHYECDCGDAYNYDATYALCDFDEDGNIDADDVTSAKALDDGGFYFAITQKLSRGMLCKRIADINRDGVSDVKDLVNIKKKLANSEEELIIDVNLDNVIDTADMVFVKKYLLIDAQDDTYSNLTYYTVTFTDGNRNVLKTQTVECGTDATAPTPPALDGREFKGWKIDFKSVMYDLTVDAVFEELPVSTSPTISVDKLTVNPGENKATVNISVLNNPGITGLKLKVEFGDILTLDSIEYNSAFGAYVTAPEPFRNPQFINFISPVKAVETSGVFATLTFSISENVTEEVFSEIKVEYDPGNTLDANVEEVAFDVVNGGITILR